ncbi:MAG: RecX family transcriptional regulator [Saprospiraceae bacterium]|nr:RecX family transcriptional regulator [Saprospiraceae bacterium]
MSAYLSRERLLEKMRHYCGYQDRSQSEAESKLRSLGADDDTAGEILVILIGEDLLSEERFAKSYARGKFRINHWGRRKITSGLKARQVPETLIRTALAEIDDDEYLDTLRQLLSRALRSGDSARAVRNLEARGFERALIYDSLRMLQGED